MVWIKAELGAMAFEAAVAQAEQAKNAELQKKLDATEAQIKAAEDNEPTK
jgi:hypothetical protein